MSKKHDFVRSWSHEGVFGRALFFSSLDNWLGPAASAWAKQSIVHTINSTSSLNLRSENFIQCVVEGKGLGYEVELFQSFFLRSRPDVDTKLVQPGTRF